LSPVHVINGWDSGEIKDFATRSKASVSKIPPLGTLSWEKVVPNPERGRDSGLGNPWRARVIDLMLS